MVTIVLTETQHRCLLDHISPRSHAYQALRDSYRLSRSMNEARYVVQCEDDEARALLAAAERDCQDAADSIRVGLRQDRG